MRCGYVEGRGRWEGSHITELGKQGPEVLQEPIKMWRRKKERLLILVDGQGQENPVVRNSVGLDWVFGQRVRKSDSRNGWVCKSACASDFSARKARNARN